jgi:hypothetical protein
MPRVGKKKFPYTKKGVADAKAYAKKHDLPIIYTEDNKAGMAVPGYAEGGGVRFYESQFTPGSPDLHQATNPLSSSSGDISKTKTKTKTKTDGEETPYTEPGGDDKYTKTSEEPDNTTNNTDNTAREEDEPIVIPEDVENYEPPEIEEETETDEELGIKKPVEQENLNQKPKVVKKPSDEYIPQSTFAEGENPNIGRTEGGYAHEARAFTPATQKPKIQLPKQSAGGGDGLASKFKGDGGGDGLSSLKDKVSGDGGGGGLADLGDKIKEKTEDIGDGVTAKKGAVVKPNKKQKLTPLQLRARDFLNREKANRAKMKTNTPGRKMHKGGKVKAKKKGVAIIIAIGKPKVNRKKK